MVAHGILFAEAVVDAIFLAFHVSVIVFLLRSRGRDPVLRNGFYDIFVLVSIADCVLLTAVSFAFRVFEALLAHINAVAWKYVKH